MLNQRNVEKSWSGKQVSEILTEGEVCWDEDVAKGTGRYSSDLQMGTLKTCNSGCIYKLKWSSCNRINRKRKWIIRKWKIKSELNKYSVSLWSMEILLMPSISSLILPDNVIFVSDAHGYLPSLLTKTSFWISVLSLDRSWWRHSGYVLRRYKIQLKNNTCKTSTVAGEGETRMMPWCVMEQQMKNRDNFVLIFRYCWEFVIIMEIKSIFMVFNGDKHLPGGCCGKQCGNRVWVWYCVIIQGGKWSCP